MQLLRTRPHLPGTLLSHAPGLKAARGGSNSFCILGSIQLSLTPMASLHLTGFGSLLASYPSSKSLRSLVVATMATDPSQVQAHLEQTLTLQSLVTEIQAGLSSLRADFNSEISSLRADVHSQISLLRADVNILGNRGLALFVSLTPISGLKNSTHSRQESRERKLLNATAIRLDPNVTLHALHQRPSTRCVPSIRDHP